MLILNNNIWLISIRQSFLNLLPYFIMIGITILSYQFLELLQLKDNIFYEMNKKILNLYSFSTPLIISTSISYFLAKNFDLNRPLIPVVNFLIFIIFYWEYKNVDEININLNLNFLMIIMPIITILIYKNISNFFYKLIKFKNINNELKEVLDSIIPFLVTFILSLFFIIIFIEFSLYFFKIEYLYFLSNLPIEILSMLNLIISGIIWWTTGIHGTNLVMFFFGENYLKQPIVGNLDSNIFINNFVIYGGDGGTLALIIAILLFIKNKFFRKIALIALPFSIFNINEIILFALPIILNIRLLLPFIIVPIINFLIAYIFFYIYPISNSITISWITPIFISGYIMDNSFTYVYLQIIQLTIAVLIYLPFIRNYEKHIKEDISFENLKSSLGIKEHVEKTLHLNSIKTQQDIINEEKVISKLTNKLSNGDFLLYYQPKIDTKELKVKGYEALLRFRKSNGNIVGPYFIEKLEQIGFEKIIDFWVINQLKKDLLYWNENNFNPKISINISPESICDKMVIEKIINDLKEFNVDIEILERTFAKKMDLFLDNINKLKNNGFTISVDDFGAGFSSLQYLNILPANSIKLDRSLILNTKTLSGKNLYKSITSMCQLQGFEVIAEGVETKEEINITKDSNISLVQGFYFSKALPFDELQNYEKKL